MRNMIRTALIVGTLATPMISMADPTKKEEPAKTDDKAKPADDKAAPKTDAKKADKKADKKTDAKKTEEKKDAKAPETK